jgi:predicted outer membrane lipoprotein
MRSRIRLAFLLASAWFAITSALATEPVARGKRMRIENG